MNILLLEDFKPDAELTSRSLKRDLEFCNIDIAASISEAKQLLNKQYDVALLDINLPDGYGTELLIELTNLNTPMVIIMMTGSGDEELAVNALKSGADDYIKKQGNYLNNLSKTITYHLKQKGEKNKKEIITVIYLEDHQSDIELTLIHFKRLASNFKIHPVTNEQEMLRLLPKDRNEPSIYQVIMMNYNLPGISAIELTKEIRQIRKLDIPIVIVTSQGSEEVAIQALRFGVDEYLVKRDNYLNRLPFLLTSTYQKFALKIKNAQLAESEQKFSHSFLYANIGNAIIGLDGAIIKANPKLCQILNIQNREIEEMNILQFIVEDDLSNITKLYFTPEKISVRNEELEFRLITKEKKIIWANASISLVKDFKNAPLYYILHLQDITIRKEALKKNKQLSLSVEQSPAMVIITDLNGKINYVNPQFTTVTGYSKHEVYGKNPKILKSGSKTIEEYKNLWKTIGKGDIWEGEFLNKKKNGMEFWESASISPLKDETGRITNFIAIKLDITDKKRDEEQIRRLNEQLEERVAERTKELHEANLKLEKAIKNAEFANRSKSEFLANMSHEIRTPMNAVLGFADILDRKIVNETHKSYLKSIKSSGRTLLSIINDILDLSKIESGRTQLHLIPVNLTKLVKEVVEMFRLKTTEKGLDLNTYIDKDIPKSLLLDELRIKQVLMNLISNAVKFTQKGYVHLKVDLQKKTDTTANISVRVKDSGIGITKEGISKILKPFEQQEGQDDKKYGGTGLGLAISDKIILLHNSKINIQSEIGEGSEFAFELKKIKMHRNDDHTSIKHNLDPAFIEFAGQTLFIVDDDNENRTLIKSYLQHSNLNIVEIGDGKLAVGRIMSESPDFVLMGMRMPGLNGLEAAKTIRNQLKFDKLPMVLLTASIFHEKEEFLSVFDGYLTKPIQIEHIIELLCQYLTHKIKRVEKTAFVIHNKNHLDNILINRGKQQAFSKSFATHLNALNTRKSNFKIKQLAKELNKFGKKHSIDELTQLGEKLEKAITSYNYEEIFKIIDVLNQCI